MPKPKSITVAPGIYRRATCFEVRVFIAHGQPQLVEYFSLETSIETMQRWQRDRRLERDHRRRPARLDSQVISNDARGTLEADVVRLLPQIESRVSFKADRSHLRACLAVVVPRDPAQPNGARCRLGELARLAITTEHMNCAITAWRTMPAPRDVRTIRVEGYSRPQKDGTVATLAGHDRKTPIGSGAVVAVKTIRHRCRVLALLFHVLEGHVCVGRGPRARWFTTTGQRASTPIDAAQIPALERTIPIDVEIATVIEVAQALATAGDPQTYARYLVLCTTGQRPCQLQRAQRADVDLERRVWIVRSAKLSPAHPITLNDDMVAAFRLLDAANAWGWYDTSKHAKKVHAAGWPAGVRPYNARHAVMLAAIRAGVPLGDVQGLAGHGTPDTTRRFYAPFVIERQRVVSEQLAGRLASVFGPQPVARQDAATAAPGAAPLSDPAAATRPPAPLALVPPTPRKRRKADAS